MRGWKDCAPPWGQSNFQTHKDHETDPDESEDLHPRREGKNCSVQSTLRRLQQNLHWREEEDTEGQTGEHKQTVEIEDLKNGIAVLAHEYQHAIDWDGATVKRSTSVTGYWQRRATEAIHIDQNEHIGTMNVDSSLQLPTVWSPILDPP